MKNELRPFNWRSFEENPSKLFAEGWALITAGTKEKWNTMTASWGTFGSLWGMDVAFIFVRPSRYTYAFIEKSDGFTLSFFDDTMRRALDVCGSKSGRDTDKAAAAGITPRELAPGRISFGEARLAIACGKAYAQDLNKDLFLDPAIAGNYPKGDLHRLYVGKIEGAWKKE
jgi:flavin reductase (DIM6/NTAB) family NADH-FMN oxidoreductase RutF